jgi:hypothetical protein
MQIMTAFMGRLRPLLIPALALCGTASFGATPLQVGQTATPSGAVGVPYSFTGVVVVSGGTAPYTYTVTSGALPAGLKLTGDTVSGTPTDATTLPYPTITVKDSSMPQQTGSALVTLNIFPAGCIVITTKSMPGGTIGQSYSQTMQASGGVKPYTWSVRTGSLPPGLKLSGSTISGTPTGGATSNGFDMQVVDSSGNSAQNTAQMPLSIAVVQPLTITTTGTLIEGVVGTAYSAQLKSTGGTGKVNWKLASGSSLVAGLAFSSSGVVSGTPTASTNGDGGFKVVATDSGNPAQTASAQLFYVINPSNHGFKVTNADTPPATQYVAFSFQLATAGGTGTVTWSTANSSTLPVGLKLAANGVISGIATVVGGQPFWVQAKDSSSPTPLTVDAFLGIQVNPNPVVITTNALMEGVEGTAYSGQLSSSGGDGAVTWKLASGSSLVAGLNLSAAGLVSGTPTGSTPGHGSFSVVATDSAKPANTATRSINYVINPSNGGFKVTTDNLASGFLDVNYETQLASSGGTGTVTWSAISGPNTQGLPTGLTVSRSGMIGGKPTVLGNFAFWVQAKDSSATPRTVNAYLDIIVNPLQAPTVSGLSPDSATAGGAAFTLTINGNYFTSASAASWGTTALATKYVSATELTAAVPASLIAKPGQAEVTVTNAAGTSPGYAFAIVPGAVAQCTNNGSGNAKLNGSYAFELSQIELSSGHQSWVIGALTADGEGKITSGLYDSNSPGSNKGDETGNLTGSYSVGPDDRGMLTLLVPSGSSSSGTEAANFCFALDSFSGGVAGGGRMVEDDNSGMLASGELYAQGGSEFTVSSAKGNWAFGMQGGMVSGKGQVGRAAVAGFLTLDGSGKITAGESDFSGDQFDSSGDLSNQFIQQTGLTGTYTLASDGRGVMTIVVPSGETGSGTSHTAFYVAGPGRVLMLGADGGSNGPPVMEGTGYLRTTTTFNNATLSGTTVFVENAISNTNSTQYDQSKVEAGFLTWDGKGNLSILDDENDAGNVTLADTDSGTYSVDANGRVTTGSSEGPNFYLVGPNQGFAVNGKPLVDFLYFENQSVPKGGFTLASFDGGYSLGTLWYGFAQEDAWNGEVTANGAGSFSEVLDLNSDGEVAVDITETSTYAAATTGRWVEGETVFYLVSPQKAYTVNVKSGKTHPPLQEINHQ